MDTKDTNTIGSNETINFGNTEIVSPLFIKQQTFNSYPNEEEPSSILHIGTKNTLETGPTKNTNYMVIRTTLFPLSLSPSLPSSSSSSYSPSNFHLQLIWYWTIGPCKKQSNSPYHAQLKYQHRCINHSKNIRPNIPHAEKP